MKILLHPPSTGSMPLLLELSQFMHEHEAVPFDAERISSAFAFLIENPQQGNVFLISADEENQKDIIGFIVLCYSFSVEFGGQIATIDQLYILSDWRRQGVGSYILPLIEKHVRERQCQAVNLEVNLGNSGAREFYEQFDYMPRRQCCIMSKRI